MNPDCVDTAVAIRMTELGSGGGFPRLVLIEFWKQAVREIGPTMLTAEEDEGDVVAGEVG